MAYEYSRVSKKDYSICQAVADTIISDASGFYSIAKENIRYYHVINFLNFNYSPDNIFCFSKEPTVIGKQYPELNRFNNLLSSIGLNLSCSDIRYEKNSFVQTVDGITLFIEHKPIVFLNASSNQFYSHVIFTIIHELIHVYESFNDKKYMKAAALIGNAKASRMEYPEELQPIENKANVITSLLYIPSCSLSKSILFQSFAELCSSYTASWSAMHNRLFNYFFYELGWNEYTARKAVFAFRNSDLNDIRLFREKIKLDNLISLDDFYF